MSKNKRMIIGSQIWFFGVILNTVILQKYIGLDTTDWRLYAILAAESLMSVGGWIVGGANVKS